jgi:hypothetical protein
MEEELTAQERRQLRRAYARISEQGWGLALGVLAGLALFVATAVLVVQNGDPLGPHLGLLSVYLPGYRVTWLGAFIGGAYAFFIGYGAGRTIGTIYNRIVQRQ